MVRVASFASEAAWRDLDLIAEDAPELCEPLVAVGFQIILRHPMKEPRLLEVSIPLTEATNHY